MDSEMEKELSELQSSEGSYQWSRIQPEACSQWHSPGTHTGFSAVQLVSLIFDLDKEIECTTASLLGEWLIHLKAVLTFSRTLIGWRAGRRETTRGTPKGECRVLHPGRKNTKYQHRLAYWRAYWRAALQRKTLGLVKHHVSP